VRNQGQNAVRVVAPTAGVIFSKLEEIDGTLELIGPWPVLDLALPIIDLDERTGRD